MKSFWQIARVYRRNEQKCCDTLCIAVFWSIIPLISSDIKPWRWIITANHHLLLANQLARKVFPRVWYTLLVFIWVPFTSHFIPVAFRWWWFWTSFHVQIEENGNRGTIGHQSQWQLEVWSSFHRFVEIHLTLGELQFILKTTEKNRENQNKTKKQKNKKKKRHFTNWNPSCFFRFWCYYHISVVHANMSGTIIHIKLNAAKAKIRIEGNDSHNNPPKKIFHEEAAVTFSSFGDV